MIMIDWVSALIPLNHSEPISDGTVLSIGSDGEIEWKVDKRLGVSGSHDQHLHIKSDTQTRCPETGNYTHIRFDGNPVKFLQGHNIFGSNDLMGLMDETLYRVFNQLGVVPTEMDWHKIIMGFYELYRVDSTMMIDLGSNADVTAFIYAAERTAHMRYKGQAIRSGQTLYWGKHSRRECLKMYNKLMEILAKGHTLPKELDELPALKEYVTGKLRAEVTTRRMQLIDLNLERASRWVDETPLQTVIRLLGGLNMSEQHTLTGVSLDGLPPRLIGIYHNWKDGHDIKRILPKATFYRYRNEMLLHGIDIAVKQGTRTEPSPNVIDFRRVLTPTRCEQVPVWAIGTPLYFEPRAKMPAYELLYPQAMTG